MPTRNPVERSQQHQQREVDTRNSVELRQARGALAQQMRDITDLAERESRNLFREESTQLDELQEQFRALGLDIEIREAEERRNANAGTPLNSGTPARRSGDVVRLAPGDSFAAHVRSRGAGGGDPLSFDRIVRGMARGNWNGADAERRAVSGLSDAVGGVLLEEAVSSEIIDLARAVSVTTQAGAQTIPMDTRKLAVPRLLTDMVPQWLQERADASDSSPSFDALELEAKTLRVYSEISEELLEDTDTSGDFISRIAAAAIGREIDRAALAGSGVGEQPLGLINQPGINVLAAAGVAKWTDLVRGQAVVRSHGFQPNAVILDPMSEFDITTAVDTQGQFVQPPAALNGSGINGEGGLRRIASEAVPINLGAGNNEALLAVADWTKLVIGWRSQIRIKTSPIPKSNSVALNVTARIDVGIERAGAFYLRRVKPSA